MPDSQNIYSGKDFNQLVENFEERRRILESQGEQAPDKEIAKEVIKSEIEKGLETMPQQPVSGTEFVNVPTPQTISHDLAVSEDEAQKILNELIEIAFGKSIYQAVQSARKTSNAYLIDSLHDQLVDKFYERLVELGKIKIS